MNEFCNLVLNIKDNDVVFLEKEKIYDVCQDDSFFLKGFYCSNTAKKHENPDGTRFSALYLDGKKNITRTQLRCLHFWQDDIGVKGASRLETEELGVGVLRRYRRRSETDKVDQIGFFETGYHFFNLIFL